MENGKRFHRNEEFKQMLAILKNVWINYLENTFWQALRLLFKYLNKE